MKLQEILNTVRGRLELLIAAIVLVMIVVSAFFLIYRPTLNTDNPGTTTEDNQQEGINLFEIENSSEAKLVNKKVRIPEGYAIGTFFRNAENSGFECNIEDERNCTILIVTNATNEFYISTPSPVSEPGLAVDLKAKEQVISTSAGDIKFNINMVKSYNIEIDGENEKMVEIEPTIVFEIKGCNSTNICFSTGVLSQEPTENAVQINAFTEFVKAVTIQ